MLVSTENDQGRRGRPEAVEHRVVVVPDRFRVAHLREAVDHEAVEAQLAHAAFEFPRGRLRVLHGKGREAAELGRVARNAFREDVIRATSRFNRFARVVQELDAR
jgi:hypothetical protein